MRRLSFAVVLAALRYGKTKRVGPSTCTSRRTGLTCHNRNGHGHGFTVSRERQTVH
jgi:hypothetical protein